MSVATPTADNEVRMARIRERIATTTADDRSLRVMLVLAHEVLRRDGAAAPVTDAESEPARASTAVVGRDAYADLVSRVHRIVTESVPDGARILVISRGDEALLVPGFAAGHFPQGRDGGYAGYYPRDGLAAVAHLNDCQAKGFEYLVLPATAYWWLDYYAELAQHLLVGGRVAHHDEHCLIFELGSPQEGASVE